MADETQFADLVFEGGGVKGIGLAGAYAALEQRSYRPKSVAGTSAGAITAALIAAGYTAAELDEILLKVPFAEFKDKGWMDKIPGVGRIGSVLFELGIYEGNAFQDWIADLLEKKGVTRFGQLVDDEAEDPKNRYRLRVIASDITHRRMLVLPNDAGHLGIEPDEMEIAYAVRMSMSIPVFFEPVVHKNKKTDATHLIVDGGMLSNFPVWLFDCEGRDPKWPTFGMMLVEPEPKKPIGHRIASEDNDVQARLAAGLRQEPRADDDGRARPALPRAVDVRAHDHHPHAGRRHHRVRHHARPDPRALRLGPQGGVGLPRSLRLRRLHRGVPPRPRPSTPRHALTVDQAGCAAAVTAGSPASSCRRERARNGTARTEMPAASRYEGP